jgi:hypothetical protein
MATGGYRVADAFRDETTGINYWLFRKLGYTDEGDGA